MLMVRAGRPSAFCINSGISSASRFKPKEPLSDIWSPPPSSFHDPIKQGSMVTARIAMPPRSERWMP